MQAEQFAGWLQGFVELNGDMPTPEQWQSIKEHLATVFVKVTPPVGIPPFAPKHPLDRSWIEDALRPGQTLITC